MSCTPKENFSGNSSLQENEYMNQTQIFCREINLRFIHLVKCLIKQYVHIALNPGLEMLLHLCVTSAIKKKNQTCYSCVLKPAEQVFLINFAYFGEIKREKNFISVSDCFDFIVLIFTYSILYTPGVLIVLNLHCSSEKLEKYSLISVGVKKL